MTEQDFRSAFAEHKDAVYRFAWRMTNSPAAAEDVAQDTFLALLRHAGRFDAGRGSLRSFLFGITRNLVLKRWCEEHLWEPLDDDAFVMPRVSIDGEVVDATAQYTGGVSGSSVSFYLLERGRYFLSLVPDLQQGFQKAGEIRGSTLKFTMGGEEIVIECNGRGAPGYVPYDLYVLQQAHWRPKTKEEQGAFLLSASDRFSPPRAN